MRSEQECKFRFGAVLLHGLMPLLDKKRLRMHTSDVHVPLRGTSLERRRVVRKDDVLRVLAAFQDSRRDEFGIVRIGVFGSVAKDEMVDTSDVDVVVEVARPDLLILVGIKQELEELLSLPVDVVRYRERMNPFLKGRIKQEAIYV